MIRMKYEIDASDKKAMRTLMNDGRASWAELGKLLGMSAPAAAERVHKLEERGIIRGYTAVVDPEALGYPLTAFVWVSLGDEQRRRAFVKGIAKMEEVAECHHVSGDEDYLLKIRCRSTSDLDRILVKELKGRLRAARTRTTVVLSTAKESTAVPISV
jgi:Lrp/AsnC family leucine-responsive transcriptional regulator